MRSESPATRDLKELDAIWQNFFSDHAVNGGPLAGVTLQEGVGAMTMRLWSDSARSWQTPERGPGLAAAQNRRPGFSATPVQPALMTGLEVTLQMRERQEKMLKVFLLGAV
jgi:hypothetical protein